MIIIHLYFFRTTYNFEIKNLIIILIFFFIFSYIAKRNSSINFSFLSMINRNLKKDECYYLPIFGAQKHAGISFDDSDCKFLKMLYKVESLLRASEAKLNIYKREFISSNNNLTNILYFESIFKFFVYKLFYRTYGGVLYRFIC